MKKFEFTGETKTISLFFRTATLHRIRAVAEFGLVKIGDLGGWIEKEENLSHEGKAWVCGDAKVWGKDYIQEDNMDVITILDIITSHIEDNDIDLFKLGFVGNGEPMLDYEKLKQYIAHIGDYLKSGRIAAYTITNGLLVDREKLEFFKEYNVNVGFSVDGISAIHDKYRCGTHERVMEIARLIYICYARLIKDFCILVSE